MGSSQNKTRIGRFTEVMVATIRLVATLLFLFGIMLRDRYQYYGDLYDSYDGISWGETGTVVLVFSAIALFLYGTWRSEPNARSLSSIPVALLIMTYHDFGMMWQCVSHAANPWFSDLPWCLENVVLPMAWFTKKLELVAAALALAPSLFVFIKQRTQGDKQDR